jgi:hypothetical protein
MRERVLTRRELNQATLARQLLLERTALPTTAAIRRVGGLQAQVRTRPTSASGRGWRGSVGRS